MSPTADLLALLGILETLKKQHRAGEAPTFGQVEDLFAHGDAVRQALGASYWAALDVRWGALREIDEQLRQARAAADRRAQETQVRILEVEAQNRELRERLTRVAALAIDTSVAATVTL